MNSTDNFLESNLSCATNSLERSFNHIGGHLCVEISYSLSGQKENGTISIKNDKNDRRLNFPLVSSELNKWEIIRLEECLRSGKYQITVNVAKIKFYIGGIHFCKKGKSADTKLKLLLHLMFFMITDKPWISSTKGKKCQDFKTNALVSTSHNYSQSYHKEKDGRLFIYFSRHLKYLVELVKDFKI
jgi:hypothetical protein